MFLLLTLTYFKPFPNVSIVDFEQVNDNWIYFLCICHYPNSGSVLEQSTKIRNLDKKINDSKSHIWNSFLKLLFWANNFSLFVHTFQLTSSEFYFNFRFSSRNSQCWQNVLFQIRSNRFYLMRGGVGGRLNNTTS